MSYSKNSGDHTKEISYISGFVGMTVGYGVAKLASIAPGITGRWSVLFQPFWKYFLPIGVIGAFIGGLVAAIISPPGRVRGSADMAGVGVGIAVCFTMLPQRPNLLMIFLITIAYGFVGFVAGSLIHDLKSTDSDVN